MLYPSCAQQLLSKGRGVVYLCQEAELYIYAYIFITYLLQLKCTEIWKKIGIIKLDCYKLVVTDKKTSYISKI
jgi:hypothetical protein